MTFLSLLKISRPRFWIYLLGPALIGMMAALVSGGRATWPAVLALFVFTFPANLFIYGINDIFDQETDRLNPKKQGYEQLFDPKKVTQVFSAIHWTLVPWIVLFFFLPRGASICFLVFLFLGAFYSAPPIRAKARPFLDALFNTLYLMPALFAWYAFGGRVLNLSLIVAGIAWCMAMHAYSAVPDIEADRASGLRTVATTLGKNGTLWFCVALYAVAACVASLTIGRTALILGGVYTVLMALSLRTKTTSELFRYYRLFPWVNTLSGLILFWWILLVRNV